MTAVARPPRGMVGPGGRHAAADGTDARVTAAPVTTATGASGPYAGRHRHDDRARHPHAAAALLAIMLAWVPAVTVRRGKHGR
jgi:hypothetical protein